MLTVFALGPQHRQQTHAINNVVEVGCTTTNSRQQTIDTVCKQCTSNAVEMCLITDEHTHLFNGPLSRTTRVSRYQNGKINLDFTEARDSEWHWHQLGHMQVCTSLQTDNHASTRFLQAGCPSCHPTNSVKALKAQCSGNVLNN